MATFMGVVTNNLRVLRKVQHLLGVAVTHFDIKECYVSTLYFHGNLGVL